MTSELKWGRNQCLYRAAPYKVIYNPNTGLHEIVKPWRAVNDPSTNRNLIREALRRELSRYRVQRISPERVAGLTLSVRALEYIETTLYPTAFLCSRCGFIVAEDPGRDTNETAQAAVRLARRLPRDMKCPREGCGGRLVQWNFLTTHECGEMIHLPTYYFALCPRHQNQDLRFHRHGSERAGDWEIVCRVPGCDHRHGRELFFYSHRDCPMSDIVDENIPNPRRYLQFSTRPIAAATNFIPKVLRILNSTTQESSPRAGSRDAVAVAVGALRIQRRGFRFHGGLNHWIAELSPHESQSPLRERRLREIAERLDDDELREQLLQEIDGNQVESDLSTNSILRDLSQDEMYMREATAVAVYNDVSHSSSIEDMLDDPTLAGETRDALIQAGEIRDDLGIAELRHVEDVNLTSCLIGYTRGDYDSARVRLQLYIDNTRGPPQVLIYTNTVQTEGLYIQLDPTRVLNWLNSKTGETHDVAGGFSTDLLSLQALFEDAHLPPFQPPTHAWCGYYYALLHTLSHLFIKQLGTFSGLEQEGLGEEIYPYQCSALVYVNQGTDFSLEGVKLAFEHHLQEILGGAIEDSKSCLYDPECEISQGACHGCVHVAEISCSNFNRLLDRRLLSPSREGGFWS